MRLLLDTTYLLPAIGISVQDLPEDAPIKLIQRGHQIFISEITIFELSAKATKHITTGALSDERVSRGIRAIVYDDMITRVPIHDSSILLTAFKLRRMLNDFIDCLILSSAVQQTDILVTEDKDIRNLTRNGEFQQFLQTTNPELKIQTLTDLI